MSKNPIEKRGLRFQEKLLNVLLENSNFENVETCRKENIRKGSPKIRLQYLTYSFDNKSNLSQKYFENGDRKIKMINSEKNSQIRKIRKMEKDCRNFLLGKIEKNGNIKYQGNIQLRGKKRGKITKVSSDKKRTKNAFECMNNLTNPNCIKYRSRNRSMDNNLKSINYTNFITYFASLKSKKKDSLIYPQKLKL